MPNRLATESSPYLLQHAHNPVDWYPWGDEAIRKAREEDKPMLVSIGYSACHWCHVMERESFEDAETAALMNAAFINIKIDREERPDLDHIYMEAVQAIAGNGGWPLNVFLTPEGKPFYGGTYFPPVDLPNRPSWKTVLRAMSGEYRNNRAAVNAQADQLTVHIAGDPLHIKPPGGEPTFRPEDLQETYTHLMKTADRVEGGFGRAPKFPQTFSIRFLLQHYYYTQNPDALAQACLSLDKMIFGGIYDQLGGGFARYATDAEWLAPHFEKMAYDNALLITALSEAYQATGENRYHKAVQETIEFLARELSSPQGGYYSALDADSEGEEGRFYVWQKKEIDEWLGPDAAEFCGYYDVTEAGNWEGKNILRIKNSRNPPDREKEGQWKAKLMAARNLRTRPQLDDKILSGWNALLITALCKAFAAFGTERYRYEAIRCMSFLENKMTGQGIYTLFHTYKDEKATIPGFLDDYAYFIEACIQLQEITGEIRYLNRAAELSEFVIQNFSEEDTGYFYYTHQAQDDIIVRKREIQDGAVPSGNSVMAGNLLYLGTVYDREDWKKRAADNASGVKEMVKKYGGSFGVWATLLNALTYSLYEIALTGDNSPEKHLDFLGKWIPNRVFQQTSVPRPEFPILRNKPVGGPSLFFLCRNYSCQQPVKEVGELIRLINNS